MKSFRTLLFVGLLPTLVGCQDYSILFQSADRVQVVFPGDKRVDAFRLPSIMKLPMDVLWVVDSSPSLSGSHQKALRHEINRFSNKFFQPREKNRLAVIGSDLDRSDSDPNQWVIGKVPIFKNKENVTNSEEEMTPSEAFQAEFFSQFRPDPTSPRLIQSLLRYLYYNEDQSTCYRGEDSRCFFRSNSMRVISFFSKSCDHTSLDPDIRKKHSYLFQTLKEYPEDNIIANHRTDNGSKAVWIYLKELFKKNATDSENYFTVAYSPPFVRCPGEYHLQRLMKIHQYSFFGLLGKYLPETNQLAKYSQFYDSRVVSIASFFDDFSEKLEVARSALTDVSAFPLIDPPQGNYEVQLVLVSPDGTESRVPKSAFHTKAGKVYLTNPNLVQVLSSAHEIRVRYEASPEVL